MKRIILTALSLLLSLNTLSHAHEFWLEPQNYQAEPGTAVAIELRNGQDFEGLELSWFDPRVDSASVHTQDNSIAYEGLPGDLPAMSVTVEDGLTVVSYSSNITKLTYDSWVKALRFAVEKDFPWFVAEHDARGLPREAVTEGYWRFSKTLIGGGTGQGVDEARGMPTEFVALSNPYAGPSDTFRARLLYQDAPRADVQVEVWDKADGEITKTLLRTDTDGIVTLPVQPGHSYQIDAVVLREPQSPEAQKLDVMWESLWANMTFAVPQ